MALETRRASASGCSRRAAQTATAIQRGGELAKMLVFSRPAQLCVEIPHSPSQAGCPASPSTACEPAHTRKTCCRALLAHPRPAPPSQVMVAPSSARTRPSGERSAHDR
eukprot:6224892-Prymnesium_polylepis.1